MYNIIIDIATIASEPYKANPFSRPCEPKKPFAREAGPKIQEIMKDNVNKKKGSALKRIFLLFGSNLLKLNRARENNEIIPAAIINGSFGILKLSTTYLENIKVEIPHKIIEVAKICNLVFSKLIL